MARIRGIGKSGKQTNRVFVTQQEENESAFVRKNSKRMSEVFERRL
jgi:hypothetical protein